MSEQWHKRKRRYRRLLLVQVLTYPPGALGHPRNAKGGPRMTNRRQRILQGTARDQLSPPCPSWAGRMSTTRPQDYQLKMCRRSRTKRSLMKGLTTLGLRRRSSFSFLCMFGRLISQYIWVHICIRRLLGRLVVRQSGIHNTRFLLRNVLGM